MLSHKSLITLLMSVIFAIGLMPLNAQSKKPKSKNKKSWSRAPSSNTQTTMPREKTKKGKAHRFLDFADMDGDGKEEWVVAQGRRLFVASVGLHPIGAHYAFLSGPAVRLFAAHLRGKRDAEVCAVVNAPKTKRHAAGERVECFALKRAKKDRNRTKLRRLFTQADVFSASDHVFVGDFDGDGRDELLALQKKRSRLTAWRLKKRSLMAVRDLGTEKIKGLKGSQLRVGRLDKKNPIRDALLTHSPKTGKLSLYRSEKKGKGWSFLPVWRDKKIPKNRQVSVANLSGKELDYVVAYDPKSGQVEAWESRLDSRKKLKRAKGVSLGDIKPYKKGQLVWANIAGKEIRQEHSSSSARHDPVIEHKVWGKRRTAVHVARYHAKSKKRGFDWFFTQVMLNPDSDQDGDGIETGWELGGYDPFANGLVFEALNDFGASPFMKDIFVEIDHMPGYKMRREAVALAVQTMAEAGINLHIIQEASQGNVRAEIPLVNRDASGREMLDGLGQEDVPWPEDTDDGWANNFDPIKDRYFTATRWSIFHYCLFVNHYWDGASSDSTGYSRGIPGSDFIVAQPDWVKEDLDDEAIVRLQAGTFLHELGHNLGLNHAGVDPKSKSDSEFYLDAKPNHVSVMNYNLQFGYERGGRLSFGYSDLECDAISESAVSEKSGIRCDGLKKNESIKVTVFSNDCSDKYGAGHQIEIGDAVDFNGRGGAREKLASFDTNCDGDVSLLPKTRNEYKDMQFRGGLIGSKPGKRFRDAVKRAIGRIFKRVKGKAPSAAGLASLKSVRKLLKKRSWKVKTKKKRRLKEMNRNRFRRLSKSLSSGPTLTLKTLKTYKPAKKRAPTLTMIERSDGSFSPKVARIADPKTFAVPSKKKSTKRRSKRGRKKKRK